MASNPFGRGTYTRTRPRRFCVIGVPDLSSTILNRAPLGDHGRRGRSVGGFHAERRMITAGRWAERPGSASAPVVTVILPPARRPQPGEVTAYLTGP